MELELVSEGPNHRFGGIGNVLISVYWGAPDAAALEDRVPWVERMRAEYGQGGLLVWVCADASGSLPDAAFRQTSRAQSERYEGTIVFSASVIEGGDLLHGLVRTFLRGLAVVASRRVSTAFFDDEASALAWVEARAKPHGGPDVATLRNALETLRRGRLG
ncbi:MAG: hypothetical protein H6719_05425 [Sandaracinaceae bacterium]|nr:hypothetical protein [Sandaracinaceae bacterium]